MKPLLGQLFFVENQMGGNSIAGWDAVANSPPDGYTLLLGTAGTRTIMPSLGTLPFDPAKDVVPVALVALSTNILVAGSAWPTGSVNDLIAFAKANPGKLAIANPAPGSLTHLASIEFQRQAGISLSNVSYRSSSLAVASLLSGEVGLMMAEIGAVLSQIKSGKLRGLVVTSAKRIPMLDEVPTAQEAGLDNLVAENVHALFAPTGTPKTSINKLATATAVALKDLGMSEGFVKLGFTIENLTPEALESYLRSQTAKWAPVAKSSGVRINY